MAAQPAQAAHSDDMPLLASPAPHVGTDAISPDQSAWKRLLVNSPPAWAASPEALKPASASAAQRIPPFPWPSPSIQIFGPSAAMERAHGKQSSEDDEEIERFLSNCSFDGKLGTFHLGHFPLRTPSPRKRGSDANSWTPAQGGTCQMSPTVGSGTTASVQKFSDTETKDTPGVLWVSPESASPGERQDTKVKEQTGEPEVQVPLRSCSCCGRRFRASRLPVHEEICSRNAYKKRSVFESSRQRCEAVSGRWWSDCEDGRASNAQSSFRSPPQARNNSKRSPGMRRSNSTPLNQSRQPASPQKATPSPARPLSRNLAGASRFSTPGCSPNKAGVSTSRRPRSVSEGRFRCEAKGSSTSFRSVQQDGRATASRRAVSLGRRSSGASASGIGGHNAHGHAARHRASSSPQVPPAGTTSKSSGCGTGTAPNLGWGTVPAMPATPDKGQGSKGRNGYSQYENPVDGQSVQAANGSLLGSIIDDVAQLSAQVERLLSRRKDLLQGDVWNGRRSSLLDRSSEVLELSPSDSSTAHGGESCRSRFQLT